MKLTPLDIQQQRFRKKLLKGYDRREVDMFMELMRNEMEELITDNMSMKQQLKEKSESLDGYKDREQTIKETMITTQQLKDDIHSNAVKEAQLIIADAKIKAEEIVNSAQNRYVEITNDIKELKKQKIQLEANLKAVLETHLKILDTESVQRQKDIDDTLTVMTGKAKNFNGK
ncbi:MAG: DivIVA domain-containing protein [Deltaproteobacteria bacterium]|nr:DivIVA domain-containing protein [Deltaproteobacteria bacterium]MCL5276829.1 DivIVA domain-containing protein [Deltaproteobacteria bacterium]